jgi:multidrug efflux pump subunit AcrA (membrane-fusion protein)
MRSDAAPPQPPTSAAVARLAALLAAASLIAGCSGAPSGGAHAAAGAPAPAPAGPPRPDERVLLTGELRAVRSADIVAPQNETWSVQIRWLLPEGTEVEEGQTVVDLDNTAVVSRIEEQRLAHIEAAIRLRVREAELIAERAQKGLDLDKARIALEKARVEAEVPAEMRSRKAYEEKRIALEKARAAVLAAERDLAAFEEAARADLDVLRLEMSKAQRAIERARRTLADLTLRAPRSGVLVHGDHPWQGRKFEVGDEVWPGLTLVRIPDLREMEVLAWLSDVDEGAVRAGEAARCTLDTYPDRILPGRVLEVGDIAEERIRDTGVRAFRVVVALDESDPALMRPGMSVKVEVPRAPARPAEAAS